MSPYLFQPPPLDETNGSINKRGAQESDSCSSSCAGIEWTLFSHETTQGEASAPPFQPFSSRRDRSKDAVRSAAASPRSVLPGGLAEETYRGRPSKKTSSPLDYRGRTRYVRTGRGNRGGGGEEISLSSSSTNMRVSRAVLLGRMEQLADLIEGVAANIEGETRRGGGGDDDSDESSSDDYVLIPGGDYTKSIHEPGDGRRSTPEAWRTYLDKKEAFGKEELSGLLKLCYRVYPKFGGEGREDDPRWDDIRRFLEEASDEEREAAAAEEDKDGDVPLHIVFCSEPPEDVVEALIDARPASVNQQDAYGRIPLHFACDDGGASEDVVGLLIDRGGQDTCKVPSNGGWIPLHFACLYGASVDVVRLLVDKGGDSTCRMADTDGMLPIHDACYRGAPADIIRVLIEAGGDGTCKKRDKQGRCPLYYGFRGAGKKSEEKLPSDAARSIIKSCGAHHLRDILDMDNDDHDMCINFRETKVLLNEGFTQRPILALVMIDLYAQVFLVASLSIATTRGMENNARLDPRLLAPLIVTCFWLTLREMIQWLTSSYRSVITDFWNWLDVSQIALVIASTHLLHSGEPIEVNTSSRLVLTCTVGIVWLALLGVVKNLLYEIAIFVVSLQEIMVKLVPFLVVSAIVIAAFVFMFHSTNSNVPYCNTYPDDDDSEEQWYCGSTGRLFAQLSAYFLGGELEIDTEISQHSPTTEGLLYVFGFVMGLIFLNVLIAKISNVYDEVENSGSRVFWRNRHSVVAEAVMFLDQLRRCLTWVLGRELKHVFPSAQSCFSAYCISIDGPDDDSGRDNVLHERLFQPRGIRDKKHADGKRVFFRQELRRFFFRVLSPIDILISFFLGLASFGIMWPKWMTRKMFSGDVSEEDEGVDEMIAGVDAKIAALDTRMEKTNNDMEEKIADVKDGNGAMEEKIAGMSDRMDRMERKMDEMLMAVMELRRTSSS